VSGVEIGQGDPASAEVQAVLGRHLDFARSHTAPEGVFALDGDDLADPAVTVFCARRGEELLAIGALRELNRAHGEPSRCTPWKKHAARASDGPWSTTS
jgi:putative acetyltransferase